MYELRVYPDMVGAKAPERTLALNDGEIARDTAHLVAKQFRADGRTEFRIELLNEGEVELSIAR